MTCRWGVHKGRDILAVSALGWFVHPKLKIRIRLTQNWETNSPYFRRKDAATSIGNFRDELGKMICIFLGKHGEKICRKVRTEYTFKQGSIFWRQTFLSLLGEVLYPLVVRKRFFEPGESLIICSRRLGIVLSLCSSFFSGFSSSYSMFPSRSRSYLLHLHHRQCPHRYPAVFVAPKVLTEAL